MNEEIAVSVFCLAYNHEKYIKKCLDSFVMQKTNFKFEVLIHDDASTDRTADIIKEYEEKYPEIIKPIYQTENQYSKGVKILSTLYPSSKGKYIIFMDGDDFWTDENKLQVQYDVMEANPSCSCCVHLVTLVKENGVDTFGSIPSLDNQPPEGILPKELLYEKIFWDGYPFQTSSYFFRRDVMEKVASDFVNTPMSKLAGDTRHLKMAAYLGDFYYIPRAMSCYRVNSIGSYNMVRKPKTAEKIAEQKRDYIASCIFYNQYTQYQFEKYLDVAICMAHIRLVCLEGKETEREVYLPLVKKSLKYKDIPSNYRKLLRIWALSPRLLLAVEASKKRIKKLLHR